MPAFTWFSGMIWGLVAISTADAEVLRTQARSDEATLRNITTIPGLNSNESGLAPRFAALLSSRQRCLGGRCQRHGVPATVPSCQGLQREVDPWYQIVGPPVVLY